MLAKDGARIVVNYASSKKEAEQTADTCRTVGGEVVVVQGDVSRDEDCKRIVAAAGQGFRARGIDGVGIDELMKTAGMTHGGFYNHFSSKEDLALEVLNQGFTDSLGSVDALIRAHPRSSRAALNAIIDSYLSTYHRDHPEEGCASAALAADAGRHGLVDAPRA